MHSFETTQSNVPAFLVKLWKLVEDTSCDDLIAWSDNGTSFIIRDQAKFAKELLPQYFKHNNMASFIRQLNMYGFRKVMNYERTSIRGESDEMEFMHSFFCKGQGSLLELIKRKIPNTKVAEPPIKSNAKDILTDLTSIKEKQETMDNMLLKMKQENELLWRELTSMRQKHKAQEQIIQKQQQQQQQQQMIFVEFVVQPPPEQGEQIESLSATNDVLSSSSSSSFTMYDQISPVTNDVPLTSTSVTMYEPISPANITEDVPSTSSSISMYEPISPTNNNNNATEYGSSLEFQPKTPLIDLSIFSEDWLNGDDIDFNNLDIINF
ncbi:heat shock factor protein 1-like [Uloborus diversus]|uniref:heat shock factor protein 1-like n=1 Tax=Uloborus diversus TaxID=327109 RepID=UPI00240A8CDD|nr:heat shock factor protein 1-like [Uloborus diversus]